jgi:hypothetical protein
MTVVITDGWLTGSLPDDTGREWPVVQRRQESSRGPLVGIPNLCLHTTETSSYVQRLKFPSQWQCGEGQIGQHIQLGLAGDAVNTWDSVLQQIEMVGHSQLGKWLPEEGTLGPVVALTAWLHKTERIATGLKRPAPWPVVVDQLPAATTDYYRRHAGVFPQTQGVYGHIEIPDNSHWDPGGFNYPRFFARVQTAIGLEDEVGIEQDIIEGSKAGRDAALGADPPANKPAIWKWAFNEAQRIRKAETKPAPGVPAPHEHNLEGKAK